MLVVVNILLLLISFYLLYKGANWLVAGASAVAEKMGISKVVVGVTMVAFGTSCPELFVNMIAAARGRTGFALSNVSGSNLTNLCLGFGICSLMGTLVIKRSRFLFDICLFFSAPLIIIFFLMVYPKGYIPLWAVIVLAVPFVFYIRSLKSRLFEKTPSKEVCTDSKSSIGKSLAVFFLGVVSLYISGELVLKAAINIGSAMGISDTIMGLTVVAAGTSIPDVAASIIAFRKNESLIAVGNLIGSNIFNILLVLPGTLIVSFKGLNGLEPGILTDYWAVFVMTTLFAAIVLIRQKTGRIVGITLLVSYFAYMGFRVITSS